MGPIKGKEEGRFLSLQLVELTFSKRDKTCSFATIVCKRKGGTAKQQSRRHSPVEYGDCALYRPASRVTAAPLSTGCVGVRLIDAANDKPEQERLCGQREHLVHLRPREECGLLCLEASTSIVADAGCTPRELERE